MPEPDRSTAANGAPTVSSANVPPAVNANPNAGPENGEHAIPVDRRFTHANRPIVDANPSATPVPLQFQPAADNSEAAVSMNTDGSVYEVRVFKKDPDLAKIEATWFAGQAKTLRIYLRNGKVIDATTGRIVNLKTASLRDLRQIAGLDAAAISNGGTRKPASR